MNPFLFFLLSVATVTDILWRRIPDYVTLPSILFGVVFWVFSGYPSVFFHVLFAFLFAYLLYRLGVWAGGDVKLFTAVASIFPFSCNVFGVSMPFFLLLFIVSLLFSFFAAIFFMFYQLIFDTELRRDFLPNLRIAAVKSLSVAILFSTFGIFGILFTFLPYPADLFAALAAFLASFSFSFLQSFVTIFVASLLFLSLAYRIRVFSKEITAENLREGDVPADFILPDGRVLPFSWRTAVLVELGRIPVRLNPLRAAGIEKQDIAWLKGVGVQKLRVKTTLPFVPFVLIAYVFISLLPIFTCG